MKKLSSLDKNLPEDEQKTKFIESKLRPSKKKIKRKEVRPTKGIDNIRILDKRGNVVDVSARFNFPAFSVVGSFSVVVPDSEKLARMLQSQNPKAKPKKIQQLVKKYIANHILRELRKLYRKKRPRVEKILIPDSTDMRVNSNG